MPQEYENKICNLISKEDNEQIISLLGVRCQVSKVIYSIVMTHITNN